MAGVAHMILQTHGISGVDFVRQFLFAELFVVGLVAIASPSFVRSNTRACAGRSGGRRAGSVVLARH
jgi:hypothetical protein